MRLSGEVVPSAILLLTVTYERQVQLLQSDSNCVFYCHMVVSTKAARPKPVFHLSVFSRAQTKECNNTKATSTFAKATSYLRNVFPGSHLHSDIYKYSYKLSRYLHFDRD